MIHETHLDPLWILWHISFYRFSNSEWGLEAEEGKAWATTGGTGSDGGGLAIVFQNRRPGLMSQLFSRAAGSTHWKLNATVVISRVTNQHCVGCSLAPRPSPINLRLN